MKAGTPKRGYAMVMALVFIALMLCVYSVAYRQVAAALRLETARTLQRQRDEGSVEALARGLALLETGLPPQDPYVCAVAIGTSRGERSFTLTFASEGEHSWSVHVLPTQPPDSPEPMPVSFAEQP
jgi:hypothetical protein